MTRTITRTCLSIGLTVALLAAGCAQDEKKDRDFFTSGSREADQRAEQQVSKSEQLRGEADGEELPPEKKSLFDRLGGEAGITTIVEDFTSRVLADPRVNWERKGIRTGGFLGIRDRSVAWDPHPEAVVRLKKHLTQFIALSTGGPAVYEGKDIRASHAGMRITNAEYDAAIGDLKATLDKLGIGTEEQKELLSIVETTRPQIVEIR